MDLANGGRLKRETKSNRTKSRLGDSASAMSAQKQGQQPPIERKRSRLAQKELRLLSLIHGNHNTSRIELAKITGASAGSMTAMVQRLIRKGLIIESGKGSASLGRKPVSLSLRSDLG